ncbi:hypothetical protein Ddc_04408 [Ditylenchus destructor]|nr:hypothetical protein Ddc_04408 [Ditylenchus destructor]
MSLFNTQCTPPRSGPRTTDEFTGHIRPEDSFWSFIFNDNAEDKKRSTILRRVVSCFVDSGGSLTYAELCANYARKYHVPLNLGQDCSATYVGLNYVFCTTEKVPLPIFQAAWQLFEVDGEVIKFVADSNLKTIDMPWEDAFKHGQETLSDEAAIISIYGDRIFKALGEGTQMSIHELIEKIKKAGNPPTHPISDLDPKALIGNLQIYYKDSFKITFDETINDVFVSRLKDKWPSKHMNAIYNCVNTPFTYPTFIEASAVKERIFEVQLFDTHTPADGIFVLFDDVKAIKQRKYIKDTLKKLFDMPAIDDFHNPKKIRIIQQNWACLLEDPDEFQRGIIVGKSMGVDKDGNKKPMVMVECVDTGDVKLAELKRLYECPRHLLGVPKCGAYILLTDKEDMVWPMSHPTEKDNWKSLFSKVQRNLGTRVKAQFMKPAVNTDYSGRRKSVVYKAQIRVEFPESSTEDNLTPLVPEIWRKKEKVYFPK